MGDHQNTSGKAKGSAKQASGTKGVDNAEPARSNSGLDVQGQMRIGDKITIGVRGEGLVLTQSHSGREVEVSEGALQGLLENEYFIDKHD